MFVSGPAWGGQERIRRRGSLLLSGRWCRAARGYHWGMRLRSIPSESRPARPRRILRTIQVLPTLITAGNLVAGVLAVSYLLDAAALSGAQAEDLVVKASWLLFIGMFLDALDGRIARMTGTTSDFGAQLDSLADVVTFGIAPAALCKYLLTAAFPGISTKLIFCFCLVYVLGAALRLARYNVESERMSNSSSGSHVTRVFRGLPSPAAAGVLASLVLLRHELLAIGSADWAVWLEWAILFFAPVLGLLMISRMPYSHVLNRYFDTGRAQPLIIVLLVLLVYLVVAHFVETVTGIFIAYALSGPVLTATNRWFGWPVWVAHEEEDEELIVPPADDPEASAREQG
jgi:CDP-diacylglycerol--serine O-phosphatidyltransferase